ncbi:MAG: hypothetical protein ACJ8AI_24890, partial [Rhodopila sp.]
MNASVPIDTSSPAYTLSLDRYDVSDPALYQNDAWYPYFERLRREAPINHVPDSLYGPYWSVSKYKDIMHCEVHHEIFSNEIGGIQIEDQPKEL